MSDPRERPWSDDPNAPKITYNLYFEEKAYLAGSFIASILYGKRKVPPLTRPPVRTHSVCSVDPRSPHRAILPMYDRFV